MKPRYYFKGVNLRSTHVTWKQVRSNPKLPPVEKVRTAEVLGEFSEIEWNPLPPAEVPMFPIWYVGLN